VIRWIPADGESIETDPPQPDTWGIDWDSRITWGPTSGMEFSPASMSAYTKAEAAGQAYELKYGFTWTPPGAEDPDGTLVETDDGDGDRIGWLDFEVNGAQVEITVTYTASIACNGPFVGYISLQRNRPAPQHTKVELTKPATDITVQRSQDILLEVRWSTTKRGKLGAPEPTGFAPCTYRTEIQITSYPDFEFHHDTPTGTFPLRLSGGIPNSGVYQVKAVLYVSDGRKWRESGRSQVRTITVR